MRITLDREIDVLKAAAERARRQGTPAGQRMSPLLRTALSGTTATGPIPSPLPAAVARFRPFPAKAGQLIANGPIDKLRDQVHGAGQERTSGLRLRPARD